MTHTNTTRAFAISISFFCSISANAWKSETDTFYGVKLGAPISDSPGPTCEDLTEEQKSLDEPPPCRGARFGGPNGGGFLLNTGIPFADDPIISFENNHPMMIYARFDSDIFHDMKKVLVLRFGQPTRCRENTLETFAGRRITATTCHWIGKRTDIALSQHATPSLGDLAITSKLGAGARQRRNEEMLNRAAKKM